jgi:hypothetical protein
MDVKLCDLCLKETGTLKVIGRQWKSFGWSRSGIRRIHYCGMHEDTFKWKGMTEEEFRTMVYEIDKKYGHYIG